jgi:feruloyl esterase
MSRRLFTVLAIAMIATGAFAPGPDAAAAAPCNFASFENLNLPETTIMLVEPLPAGQNSSPVGEIALPICRVRGVIAPANLFEVWMPTADWNGKFQGVGNGGLAGSISFGDMRAALSRNYATASTDTGHSSNAPGDPWWTNAQQIKDYGYRSIHELTVKSKRSSTPSMEPIPTVPTLSGVRLAADRRSWKPSATPTTTMASSVSMRELLKKKVEQAE